MKVAFCSSEVFPFAKTGGLADVSGALPWALADEGCEVKVFMPLYKNINPQILDQSFGISKVGNVEVIFVRNDNYFLRDALYGTPKGDYPDNLERFAFFNNQVIEIMRKINFNPNIVHCNDWQTAPLIIFLRTKYKDVFKSAKLVLTIHNLAYQGIFPQDKFSILGISGEYFSIQYLEFYGKINLLKGGIVFADMVNTVSPTYAKQIQTQEFGCGLEGVLREKKDRLIGILNAIDYSVWDPYKDKFIYKNYSPRNLEDKYINKNRFQKEFGLAEKKNTLLLGMVSRLAEQKGIDILSKGLEKILKKHQVVILGLGEEKYHKILQDIEKRNKKSFVLFLKFDEELAHKIYASCDCFLLPSRFEPCGLSQMISYRYATVPIVHHTGGLADTVVDYSDKGGGFVFKNYSEIDLINTIERAKEVFERKEEWLKLLKKITKYNFSWQRTAKEYMNMYRLIL
ncbi:MAG: glycogen synthase [Candidatus Omnitrophica bacterium]|nr:glycogen synthase [Candidatus Omnitrophota bacterium]MCM8827362.1 glycogen synthase [Candidatus Omnitrophota bacterium]